MLLHSFVTFCVVIITSNINHIVLECYLILFSWTSMQLLVSVRWSKVGVAAAYMKLSRTQARDNVHLWPVETWFKGPSSPHAEIASRWSDLVGGDSILDIRDLFKGSLGRKLVVEVRGGVWLGGLGVTSLLTGRLFLFSGFVCWLL